MKKILNVIIGVLLLVCIALFVVFLVKYNNLQNEYDMLVDESIELENNYNTMSQNYISEKTAKEESESKYKELQANYETLESDYNELEALYLAETEVIYEEPTDLSQYASDVTYENLARTPDDYEGKAVTFRGEVVQVMEGEEENHIRLAVNGDYDQMLYIGYEPQILEERILEGDYITIYGLSIGIYSYESTMGALISIPGVWVDYIEME